MAVTYDVPKGQVFALHGPATVTVKSTVEEPVIGELSELQAEEPRLDSLDPTSAVSGDADVVLHCMGGGFTQETVIVFGDYDEPTTFVSEGEVTTGVKPSLFVPAVVPVTVRNGPLYSAPLDFTFTDAAAQSETTTHRSRRKT